jgi:hypothetical protein
MIKKLLLLITKYFSLIDKFSYISILINIIIFYSLQYLLFKLLLSKLLNKILSNKLEIIKTLMDRNKLVETIIKRLIEKNYNTAKENNDKEKAIRDKINKKVTYIYVLLPIMIMIGIIIFLILYKRKESRKWNIYDTLNLILIFIAYLTEIYFLLLIVNKYIFIGDQELIYIILNNIL